MVEQDFHIDLESIKSTFVIGVAHSGTTILYRLLGRHEELAWFSQFSQRSGTIPERFSVPFWGIYNRIARTVFGVPWQKKRGLGEYIVPRPMEANSIWNYLIPSDPDADIGRYPFFTGDQVNDAMENRFREIFSEELNAWKRDQIICKAPRLSKAVSLISTILPRARFIHVIRDGRAVAMSNLHKFERRFQDSQRALRQSARHWKSVVEGIEERRGESLTPGRLETLKLEDFQQSPRENVEELLTFMDLDLDSYPWPLPEIKENTNKKWKEKATPPQIETMEQELSGTLKFLDYQLSWLE